jgi:hypothetical protein
MLADQAPLEEVLGLVEKQWTKVLAEHREAVETTELLLAEEQSEWKGETEREGTVTKMPELEGFEWARGRMILLIGSSRKSDATFRDVAAQKVTSRKLMDR